MNPKQRLLWLSVLLFLILVSVNGAIAQRSNARGGVNVVLRTRQDRMYRTFLREAIRHPANFAGHYVLEGPGCGMECENYAAIDKSTGRVIWLPFFIENSFTTEAEYKNQATRFFLDSNRIVVFGRLVFDDKHTESGPQTWQLVQGRFARVRR